MKMLDLWDEHWRSSLPIHLGSLGTGGLLAWLSHLDWGSVLAGAGAIAAFVGGPMLGLYKQWRLARIDIQRKRELARIEVEERRRQLAEQPTDRLNPDDTARAGGFLPGRECDDKTPA